MSVCMVFQPDLVFLLETHVGVCGFERSGLGNPHTSAWVSNRISRRGCSDLSFLSDQPNLAGSFKPTPVCVNFSNLVGPTGSLAESLIGIAR